MSKYIRQQLMLPGPTPIPESVLQELSAPMIGHRSAGWAELFEDVEAKVKWVFQTQNDVMSISGSGSGGLEAAVVNTLSPGDKVLALEIGVFGERFSTIAEAYGAQVDRLQFEFGTAVDLDLLEARLAADTNKEIKAVLVTHNETSTSVLNPLESIAKLVKSHGALILVDAISSLVSTNLPVDKWDLDVVVGGSQKAFMIPPGLAFVTFSDRAWEAYKSSTMPKFYFDFKYYRDYRAKSQTPWTPPITLFFGLKESLRLMQEEGLPQLFKRHEQMMKATRAGVQALGFSLFVPDENIASRAVTGIVAPEGMDAEAIRKGMLDDHHIVLAGGQRALKGKLIRVGHLGYQGLPDILSTLAALEIVMKKMGHSVELGSAVAAAQQTVFNQ